MTNPDLTLIGVLADHSGSMRRCREDTEGGINTLLEDQTKEPGLLDVAIAEFDHRYNLVRPMGRVEAENPPKYTLTPQGNTAMLDAMARFITDIGGVLASKSESERPSKVIIVIGTDGLENASQEYRGVEGRKMIKEMVEKQQSEYQWQFIFLGANMDAISEGGSLGVPMASSMTYNDTDGQAVMDSYAVASAGVSMLRSTGQAVSFSDSARRKAMGEKGKAGIKTP